MTAPDILSRTLAAYALNLLYAAKLEPFEEENLINLCREAGVEVTLTMVMRREEKETEIEELLLEAKQYGGKLRRQWWRFWG